MKKNCLLTTILLLLLNVTASSQDYSDCGCDYIITKSSNYQQYPEDLKGISPGDVICFAEDRTIPIRFKRIEGSREKPIIIKNCGGQIFIPNLELDSCKHIKVTGAGDLNVKYGLRFSGKLPWVFGVSLNGLSSDIELEYLHIGGPEAGFGVVAKKDYSGNPPTPLPVFENLIIHDLLIDEVPRGCGMYIGETKTPAMEFKHVRIYNNVVINCGRENIQVGHCNEDAEVYNNFCMNAGELNLTYQGNNMQLGYRTEGYYYNNVFINAPSFSITCLTNRGFSIFNNYSEENRGMFIDDREDEHEEAPIKVHHNYFYNNNGEQYFQIYNEKTKVMFYDNLVNDDVSLYSKLGKVEEDSLVFENNILGQIAKLEYNDIYQIIGHYYNKGMGPLRGITHKFNYDEIRTLQIAAKDSIYLETNIPETLFVSCVNRTEKPLIYAVSHLPPFAQFVDNQNGTAMVTFLLESNEYSQNNYTFNINVQEVNGDSDDISVDIQTNPSLNVSLKNKAASGFRVCPNPASYFVNIEVPNNGNDYEYQFINIKGQVIKKCHISAGGRGQVSISDLNKGLYIIKLTSSKNKVEKLISYIRL